MKRILAVLIAVLLLASGVRADITSNLVAHWKLDETSGTSAADSSGNGYTGTYVNTPTLGVAGAFGNSKAVAFTAASSESMTASPSFAATAGTMSCWLKRSGVQLNYARPVACGVSTTAVRIELVWQAGGTGLYIETYGQVYAGGADQALTLGTIPDATWTHVVITWDALSLKGYVNGSAVSRAGNFSFVHTFNSTVVSRRFSANDFCMTGTIDDVRIYSRALSAADVAALYAYTGARFPYWYFNSSGCDPFKVFRTRQPLAILTIR